eukprot:scaffold27212_cov72-Skeletonema_dohrnii-CCMP3373.AAC.1
MTLRADFWGIIVTDPDVCVCCTSVLTLPVTERQNDNYYPCLFPLTTRSMKHDPAGRGVIISSNLALYLRRRRRTDRPAAQVASDTNSQLRFACCRREISFSPLIRRELTIDVNGYISIVTPLC